MKRKMLAMLTMLILCAVACAQPVCDSAWRPWVKTVTLCRPGAELEPPLLVLGSGERLELAFDLLVDQPLEVHYSLRHCNARWEPDSLEPYDFINGFERGAITRYDASFTTLRPYFHYRHSLPEPYSEFTHSGNYILTVYAEGQGDSVLFTRRFCVTEQSVGLGGETTRPYDGIHIDRRQEVDAYINPEGQMLNHQYLTLIAQQNGRLDNQRQLQFSGYDRQRLTYRQRPCNLFDGGNTFRFFDAANLRSPMYNIARIEEYGGEYYAILRPEEDRSAKHFIAETTLNGGMKVNAWDRRNPTLEAEYVWVNFSLPMAQPMLGGTVHIVGQLTDWQLDSASRMDYNPQYRAYTRRLLLKQGYYAYQLIYKPMRSTEGETARLEGNHWQVPNRYTLYLYQRTPSDRADRLLAVASVTAP